MANRLSVAVGDLPTAEGGEKPVLVTELVLRYSR